MDLKAIADKDTIEVIKILGKTDYKTFGYGQAIKLGYRAQNLEVTLKDGNSYLHVIRNLSYPSFDKQVLEKLCLKVKEPTFVVPQQ